MSRRLCRTRPSSRPFRSEPWADFLEARELLSTTPGLPQGPDPSPASGIVSHPMFELGPLASSTPPPGAYTPAQIQQAYGFNKITFGAVQGDGTGQTIAIVDAQDDPNIQADLNTFDAQFGLPSTTVTRVNQAGGTSYPATDSTGGWETEESLDVEWAHAMAPGAKILLVEASSASDTNLLAGVDYAAAHANVVSMSWGGGEFSGENSYDGHFNRAGVAFVASSGDSGAPISWPAASPNVVAVGGTALTLGAGGTYSAETGWSGSGGGPSAYEAQPSYQSGVVTQTSMRANPDVAYDASPSTGFAVYDSFNGGGGWLQVGGTSAGAPQWAALLAIADQGRALNGLPALDSASPKDVLTTLYGNATTGDFHDVTSGSSTGSPSYSAGAGYDYVTGLGSPLADRVAASLAGTAQASADHLAIAATTAGTAGSSFSVTVTALNSGGTADAGYTGTVHFTSSDVQAGLPADYTFGAADAGSHTFTVTLKTAGSQSITATDTTTSAGNATTSGIAVSPAAASQIILTGLPSTATAGASQTVTATARDPYGNVATSYAGTTHFTSTDAQAVLPGSYTFSAADKGVHSFSLTFETAGSQSITVADGSGLTATQSGIAVSPAAPINLSAAAASDTQVTLNWTGSAGAASYLIERSANGSTGWTQIATTPAGTTTYQDAGLSPGTTYYYRVRASGGNVNSSYSNTAGATTTGTGTGTGTTTVDTLWSNTYTPPENAYSAGSYEVGVKFRTDVAGTVTGVRFYKQTWMGGYAHVGHLWSSTGALLATATFTNETSYGWEQVNFSSPVSVAANTVYIVSFSTGGGYFGITTGFFNNAGVDNGPLHALANGVSGGDGVYHSGNGTFPSVSGSGMNFWADVAFAPTSSPSIKTSATSQPSPSRGLTPASVVVVGLTNPAPSPASAVSSSLPSGSNATSAPGSWPYRNTVPQALTQSWSRGKGIFSFGPFGS